jgi:hypothetical protein
MKKRPGMSKEEAEIEASKVYWTQQTPSKSESSLGSESAAVEQESCTWETNKQLIEHHQKGPSGGFFMEMDSSTDLGKKLAEGGQAEIFLEVQVSGEPRLHMGRTRYLLKVYKRQRPLQKLLEQRVPKGMVDGHALNEQRLVQLEETPDGTMVERVVFTDGRPQRRRTMHRCNVSHVVLLKDGRLAFRVAQYSTDLRTFIDRRIETQSPPFDNDVAIQCMLQIAMGMQDLHKDGIIHSDLKAANVLISNSLFGCEPEPVEYPLYCWVADFECSVGCFGTGFWRSPQILQALRDLKEKVITLEAFGKIDLYTKESDVYSYAMTCYEVLTGLQPFENEGYDDSNYDVVFHGERPKLPSKMKDWIKGLLRRCWSQDPSERPTFDEIVNIIEKEEPSAKACLLTLWMQTL